MRRVSVIYRGRVQGVGFRATARSIASRFEVTGWVRNEPDGTVRLEVQGEDDQVDRVLEAITDSMGRGIDGAAQADLPIDTGETGFGIKR